MIRGGSQLLLLLLTMIPFLAGCGGPAGGSPATEATLTIWSHAGRAAERRTLAAQIARFQALEPHTRIHHVEIPEGTYNGQVQAAGLAGQLPDVLEVDGPYVASFAWEGLLRSLDGQIPSSLKRDLLSSVVTQGTYHHRLFAVGVFDSGLGLFARRSRLRSVGARIPNGPGDAWSVKEFNHLLNRLANQDPDGRVLDLKLNYPGEWLTYGFSPVLWSAGAGLVDRPACDRAEGILDSPAAIGAMTVVQSWFRHGYVDPNTDDAAFVDGRVAISWVGHWEYPRYHEATGSDLVLLPLPDFGHGSRTGQGSWMWALTRKCRNPSVAGRFLRFLLRTPEILAMTNANGAVPARANAIAQSPLYRIGGPLRLYVEQLTGGYAVARPRTPAYPVISSIFQQAFRAIRNEADVAGTLRRAARSIDQDMQDNHDYPFEIKHDDGRRP